MPNMSYCRFENTVADLRDCYESMEEPTSPSEHRQRMKLIRLCHSISDDFALEEMHRLPQVNHTEAEREMDRR